jgi:hypothetical protein
MTEHPALILRTDEHGALDDIVAQSVDMAHLERLDTGVWWLGLTSGRTTRHFWLRVQGRRLEVTTEEEQT